MPTATIVMYKISKCNMLVTTVVSPQMRIPEKKILQVRNKIVTS